MRLVIDSPYLNVVNRDYWSCWSASCLLHFYFDYYDSDAGKMLAWTYSQVYLRPIPTYSILVERSSNNTNLARLFYTAHSGRAPIFFVRCTSQSNLNSAMNKPAILPTCFFRSWQQANRQPTFWVGRRVWIIITQMFIAHVYCCVLSYGIFQYVITSEITIRYLCHFYFRDSAIPSLWKACWADKVPLASSQYSSQIVANAVVQLPHTLRIPCWV